MCRREAYQYKFFMRINISSVNAPLVTCDCSSLQEFVNSRNYPFGTQVTRELEGMETNTFRRYFDLWEGEDINSVRVLDGLV